jgi:hypothetical protein
VRKPIGCLVVEHQAEGEPLWSVIKETLLGNL